MKTLKNFVGWRIVKTAIAVFMTALICHLFGWSAMFAVIAAIVSIEPTTSDSIKKALVRFPATAIGAAYAVLFTFLFKDSAFSYAFVTLATFITCHKLKLHAGTLVATITGAAMITTVQDQYFMTFFERLASTSTGLVVASLVNHYVLPPNYAKPIRHGVHGLFERAGDILEKRGNELLLDSPANKELQNEFRSLVKEVDRVANLYLFQKAEWRFHRVPRIEIRKLRHEYKKLMILRGIVHHIGNLIYLHERPHQMETVQTERILSAIQAIKGCFNRDSVKGREGIKSISYDLSSCFYHSKPHDDTEQSFRISTHTAILYEILSISDLTARLVDFQSHK